MITRSGDSVVYRLTVTEPEALLDHQEGLLLRNRWLCFCRGSWIWEIAEGGQVPLRGLTGVIRGATTRLTQGSWVRPGGLLAAVDWLSRVYELIDRFLRRAWGDFWDIPGFSSI